MYSRCCANSVREVEIRAHHAPITMSEGSCQVGGLAGLEVPGYFGGRGWRRHRRRETIGKGTLSKK
jgi:hypothetical protein